MSISVDAAMTPRRIVVCSSLLFTVACGQDPIAPPNAIVGRFGGRATEIVASADRVRVQFVCGFAVFPQPLVPDAEGRFNLAPVLVQSSQGTTALALKGVANSTQIAFDAVALSSSGQVTTTHHVVRFDQPADYSRLTCLTGGTG